MPTLPFLGGILNRMFFGIPYFMYIILAMMIFGVFIVAVWYLFFWYKLTPYHGLLWATMGVRLKWALGIIPVPKLVGKTGLSFVFDDNMNMDLITDRSSKVIFAETFKEAQEAEGDNTPTPSATIGKVHADFIFDPDKWTYPDSQQHKIIEDIAEAWNNANPDDQVRTLYKFSKYLHEGKFDTDQYSDMSRRLKRHYMVPWSRIQMMYKDREESGTFGYIMTLANMIKAIEGQGYNAYAVYILLLFGFMDLLYFAAWFISRKPA